MITWQKRPQEMGKFIILGLSSGFINNDQLILTEKKIIIVI